MIASTLPLLPTGRPTTPAAGARPDATAGATSFASLIDANEDATATAEAGPSPDRPGADAAATGRQADAAGGNPVPLAAAADGAPAPTGDPAPAALPKPVRSDRAAGRKRTPARDDQRGGEANAAATAAAGPSPIATPSTIIDPRAVGPTATVQTAAAAEPGLAAFPPVAAPPSWRGDPGGSSPSPAAPAGPATIVAADASIAGATDAPPATVPTIAATVADGDRPVGVPPALSGAAPTADAKPAPWTPPTAAAVIAPTIAPATAIAPAAAVFADAIHAAGRGHADLSPGGGDPLLLSATTLAAPSTIDGVAAAARHDQPTLDLRQDNWPGAMIEHIEKLRDAADATDTRIRVVPDALGGIDVALRRGSDGVQVRLSADQPATRAMLAEAQPQLTRLAEARGIRLGDTQVAGGPGGGASTADGWRQPQGQAQPQPAPAPRAPAPAPATSAGADIPADTTATRVA